METVCWVPYTVHIEVCTVSDTVVLIVLQYLMQMSTIMIRSKFTKKSNTVRYTAGIRCEKDVLDSWTPACWPLPSN